MKKENPGLATNRERFERSVRLYYIVEMILLTGMVILLIAMIWSFVSPEEFWGAHVSLNEWVREL